jgi:hypothetical protein
MKNPLAWLIGGNDHQLAATRYPHQQSATERANSKSYQRTALNLLAQGVRS